MARMTFLIPSKSQMIEWRLVCSTKPFRASIKRTAKVAVEAPLIIFLVNSICPGVSATMNFLFSVSKYL